MESMPGCPPHAMGPVLLRARISLGELARRHGDELRCESRFDAGQLKALAAIERCRTAALGGHLQRCTHCGDERPAYNSCRNRHCPACQGFAQARWIEQRRERILPTTYFHVVFTLPSTLRRVVRRNRALLLGLLFRAAAETLLELSADPRYLGATPAITAVLHTWTRDLKYHPHLHCIVSGGGLSASGAWIDGRNPRFLFPVRVLGALFRGKYLDALYRARASGDLRFARDDLDLLAKHRTALYEQRWVVYAKRPFGGAEQVYEYLGRYTHRVGISNARLRSLNADDTVSFVTKHNDVVTLPVAVFLRRFLQHTLPDHFVKIRHYGLLAPSAVPTKLATARAAIASRTPSRQITPQPVSWASLLLALVGTHATKCLRCGVDAVERGPLHSPELPPSPADTS